ncbi:MAG TPA: toll/interleukin-1 receptor domain-containing protein [Candidatus Eisenbacteria bacterium]|nr:toll/interleukin-1 receptor domain-containing protein [Candidatus Eisenbacteria bacterium]
MSTEKEWDVFVCHASEDKEDFVRPLALELDTFGLRVWFDEFTLKLGDSLRERIDEGLALSRYGAVVLSPAFLEKNWPAKELNGLFAREVEGRVVILPIWHKLGKVELLKFSPLLADKVAANSADGIKAVVTKIVEVVKPEALEMQEGIERVRRLGMQLDEQVRKADNRLYTKLSVTAPGDIDIDQLAAGAKPGIIASIIKDGVRVDLFAADPESYARDPLKVQMVLRQEAWEKIENALKTGETVTLDSDLAPEVSSDLVSALFPKLSPEFVVFGPSPDLRSIKIPARLALKSGIDQIVYDFIEIGVDRAGTHEAVLVSRSTLPLTLEFTLRVGGTATFSLTLAFAGHEIGEIAKARAALKMLAPDTTITLTDLRSGTVILEAKASDLAKLGSSNTPDRILDEFIQAVLNVAQKTSQRITWPDRAFTRDDYIDALTLAEIVSTGASEGTLHSLSFSCPVAELEALRGAVKLGSTVCVQFPKPPTRHIFGVDVDTGPCFMWFVPSEITEANPSENPEVLRVKLKVEASVKQVFPRFRPQSPA